jgi:cephalosporin-C deacetylase-like acetyl esterase
MVTKRVCMGVMLGMMMCAPLVAQTRPATAPAGPFGRRGGRGPAGPAVTVTADHADWNYQPGEPVKFTIAAPAGTSIRYTIGKEMMPAEAKTAVVPESGKLDVDGGTLAEPGFLRCVASVATAGRGGRGGLATAAFAPEKIQPTQTEPADFDRFWAKAEAELAAVPVDAKLTPMPDQSDEKLEAFEVNLQNIGAAPGTTSRFYGILYVPRGEGPFPAMICFPGAGVRGPDRDSTFGWAARGFIVLYVGIHEMPVVPVDGAPAARPPGNYTSVGLEDPNTYYFRRVLMGCVRGDDYLIGHPKWDKKNLLSVGGSQGGYLSLATTALDPRVTACIVEFPAFCDLTGYIHGRAGGYPRMLFDDMNDPQRDAKIKTTAYYDGVNFAKRIKVPGYYGWGYNDDTCPPDSTFSAYNVITAPKTLNIVKEMGHNRAPGFLDGQRQWLLKLVGIGQ